MNYSEAFAAWSEDIRPMVIATYGANDVPALSEIWNDYTDSLCKDGELTATQYHYCPAYDDRIPRDWDEERDYILEAMGVTFLANVRSTRTDGLGDWVSGSSHYAFTITRGTRSIEGWYSMGPALSGGPSLQDVMASLLMDTSDLDDSFEDWADNLGMDSDSRKAERIYNACRDTLANLERMFTQQELEDLREMFADY